MEPDENGSAGADRTMRLLWRHHLPATGRRGPRPSHSLDEVVAAAVALADDGGLGALSVRTVAREVGMAPMSLYTHVPGKAELLHLMLDSLYGQVRLPRWRTAGWRQRVTAVAAVNRRLLREHPWLTELAVLSRPSLGPGQTAKYERELAAFDDTGLDDVQVDAALTLVLGFVQQQARSERGVQRAVATSGVSDQQWWRVNGPLLAELLDPSAYPRAVRIGAAAGETQGAAYDPDRAWDFGLARILDGLAVLVES